MVGRTLPRFWKASNPDGWVADERWGLVKIPVVCQNDNQEAGAYTWGDPLTRETQVKNHPDAPASEAGHLTTGSCDS